MHLGDCSNLEPAPEPAPSPSIAQALDTDAKVQGRDADTELEAINEDLHGLEAVLQDLVIAPESSPKTARAVLEHLTWISEELQRICETARRQDSLKQPILYGTDFSVTRFALEAEIVDEVPVQSDTHCSKQEKQTGDVSKEENNCTSSRSLSQQRKVKRSPQITVAALRANSNLRQLESKFHQIERKLKASQKDSTQNELTGFHLSRLPPNFFNARSIQTQNPGERMKESSSNSLV